MDECVFPIVYAFYVLYICAPALRIHSNYCPLGSTSPTPCVAGTFWNLTALETAAGAFLCLAGYDAWWVNLYGG